MVNLNQLSLINKHIKYKLMIAFSLMTIIPLLACVYLLSPYLVPESQNIATITLVIFVAIIISILGFIIARKIVNSIVDIAVETREISGGKYDKNIASTTDDELGSLSDSINTMTKKIKTSLEELRNYGQSMKEINVEVQKRITAFSNLLQIDNIISAGSMQIDALLELEVSKTADIFDTGFGVLYMPREEGGDFIAKVCYNIDNEKLPNIVIKRGSHGVLERVIEDKRILQVADDDVKLPKDLEEFKRANNLKNFLAIPVYSSRVVFGLLIIGNRLSDFKYTNDDIDLVTVFAKHVTIAVESDTLNKKNKELATRDDLTGLFNKRYVLIRLEEEIKRAVFYQRPCSFAVFSIDNFNKFREMSGELASEEALKQIAKVIRDNNIPIGRAARIGGNEFAMLLPEKNKKEASNIAEDVRKKIENTSVMKDGKSGLSVSMGLSENPIDGITSDELFKKAMASLEKAKLSAKNHISA